MVTLNQIEKVLKTYSLEEIIELNNLTEDDVLYFLIEQNFVSLPSPMPVDLDD